MKFISKRESPRELIEWFQGQYIDGQLINCRFDNLESSTKTLIKQQLLEEQGWLCCYTGLTIENSTSHIEHLLPQSISKNRGTHEDVDYQNMLAAYPKNGKCPYGAKARDNKQLPVHPLQTDCEAKFRFDIEGRISGVDRDATDTIEILKLCLLTDERKTAISEVLFSSDNILSQDDLRRFAKNYCMPDENGKLRKFCFVIAQVAQQLFGF
jgi:uncharacterized protein (TIGR02646 family)